MEEGGVKRRETLVTIEETIITGLTGKYMYMYL